MLNILRRLKLCTVAILNYTILYVSIQTRYLNEVTKESLYNKKSEEKYSNCN